ncbi:hypothetical protein MLD38_008488 [Melastoma candidum]|uniref:Uncharacterized protein n=1 Tax=Melastoma candidum TaxID=119954 RepID=A0ACB9RV06_9MYRT|nr:hypothetical protein MLD38_008488 [Melastoma candidum]
MMMMSRPQPPCDHHSRLLHDLSTLVLNLLRSPLSLPHDPSSSPLPPPRIPSSPSITPAGFASLMLGMSLALMFCGSVTFFIGFMLMPWVLCLVVFLYLAGIVSALSFLGRSLLCFATGPPAPKKDIPSWKLLEHWDEHDDDGFSLLNNHWVQSLFIWVDPL